MRQPRENREMVGNRASAFQFPIKHLKRKDQRESEVPTYCIVQTCVFKLNLCALLSNNKP